jgi:hypothetical protein
LIDRYSYSTPATVVPAGADEYRLLTAAVFGSVMLAVMTSTTQRTPVACRPPRLFRYVGGVELPVAGMWHVPGGHADIGFWLPRWLRRTERWRGRAAEATIVVGQALDDLQVAVVLDAGLATVNGRSGSAPGAGGCLVAGADSGPLPWAVSGEMRANGAGVPLRASLDYHGVWRRGDRAYGWFTLAGAIDPHPVGGRAVRFCFDLLADGPGSERGVA